MICWIDGCPDHPRSSRGQASGHDEPFPRRKSFSPAALETQAFGEIARKIMLAEVHQLAIKIDPDLAADVAPAAAEREILRQIAAGIGIDHAVEEQPVQMCLRVRRTVRNVVELGVFL